MKFLTFTLVLFSTMAFADFNSRKTEVLSSIDQRIAKLQEHRACVQNATDKNAMKTCRAAIKEDRQAMKEKRHERKQERKRRRESRNQD